MQINPTGSIAASYAAPATIAASPAAGTGATNTGTASPASSAATPNYSTVSYGIAAPANAVPPNTTSVVALASGDSVTTVRGPEADIVSVTTVPAASATVDVTA